MGRAKATLPLPGGGVLAKHVVNVALSTGRWINEIVILGSRENLPDSLAHLRLLADAEPGAGPLAGLISLLPYAGDRWGMLLASDMPLLEPMLLERLCTAVRPECDVVAFLRPDQPDTQHACCALYHPRILPRAARELREGRRSLLNLLRTSRALGLEPVPAEQEMLANLNTPQDYDRLLQHP